jgi:hypothetical protein
MVINLTYSSNFYYALLLILLISSCGNISKPTIKQFEIIHLKGLSTKGKEPNIGQMKEGKSYKNDFFLV